MAIKALGEGGEAAGPNTKNKKSTRKLVGPSDNCVDKAGAENIIICVCLL